jgi:hypothetical protein
LPVVAAAGAPHDEGMSSSGENSMLSFSIVEIKSEGAVVFTDTSEGIKGETRVFDEFRFVVGWEIVTGIDTDEEATGARAVVCVTRVEFSKAGALVCEGAEDACFDCFPLVILLLAIAVAGVFDDFGFEVGWEIVTGPGIDNIGEATGARVVVIAAARVATGARSVVIAARVATGARSVVIAARVATGARSVITEPRVATGARSVVIAARVATGARSVITEPRVATGARSVVTEPRVATGARSVVCVTRLEFSKEGALVCEGAEEACFDCFPLFTFLLAMMIE